MFGFGKPKIEFLDKYLANKEYDKALSAIVNELKKNPTQFNLLLRQAEILGLAGNRDRAIEVYRELAEHYGKAGFYAKSIALYKKVLRLNPELDDVHSELARLIEEQELTRRPLEERLAASRKRKKVAEEEILLEEKELQASSLFKKFPHEALENILVSTSLRSYQEGDIIVTEGEPGSSLFLIVSGAVKVFTRGNKGEHIPLAELGPGDFFGEVSLLTGRPRTATITAKTHVNAIELPRDSMLKIIEEHPEVRKVLEDFYESRAQATVETPRQRSRPSFRECEAHEEMADPAVGRSPVGGGKFPRGKLRRHTPQPLRGDVFDLSPRTGPGPGRTPDRYQYQAGGSGSLHRPGSGATDRSCRSVDHLPGRFRSPGGRLPLFSRHVHTHRQAEENHR